MKATAKAHANIALVKYWGKRDLRLNLPAVGSISMTLDALSTTTTVHFSAEFDRDELWLNDKPADEKAARRTSRFLDIFRTQFAVKTFARIDSSNNFPTGAGLASSASGFAALTKAVSAALNLSLSPKELTQYARIGSGSAARSIFGGFVEMHRGKRKDGSDAFAEQLYPADYWPLEMLILITSEAQKPIGSTEGMNLTAETSPYFDAWVQSSMNDISEMHNALREKDFEKLGVLSEFSCFKMHALAMSANPAILYWNPETVRLIHEIRKLRKEGVQTYLTMDAGPQVKVICFPEDAQRLAEHLSKMEGVRRVLRSQIGGDSQICDS